MVCLTCRVRDRSSCEDRTCLWSPGELVRHTRTIIPRRWNTFTVLSVLPYHICPNAPSHGYCGIESIIAVSAVFHVLGSGLFPTVSASYGNTILKATLTDTIVHFPGTYTYPRQRSLPNFHNSPSRLMKSEFANILGVCQVLFQTYMLLVVESVTFFSIAGPIIYLYHT